MYSILVALHAAYQNLKDADEDIGSKCGTWPQEQGDPMDLGDDSVSWGYARHVTPQL